MVQVTTYDSTTTSTPSVSTSSTPQQHHHNHIPGSGRSTSSRDVLARELGSLSQALQTVHRTSTTRTLPQVPPELVTYVDNGRNPDVYTREFVELVRRGNQLMAGKERAFAAFRDVLAAEIESAMPELRGDVDKVLDATGGRRH